MSRHIAWAVIGSILLHLALIGGVRLANFTQGARLVKVGTGKQQPPAIQVHLLPRVGVPETVAEAVAVPGVRKRLSVAPESADQHPARKAAKTARAITQSPEESGTGAKPEPPADAQSAGAPAMQGSESRPLVLDLPAKWSTHAPSISLPQRAIEPDRPPLASKPNGSVDIYETQGPMGERRANVTTPWGRYCMRERRSAGPYDARRDRGMDAVTCPDG